MVGVSTLAGVAAVQQNQNIRKADAKLQAAIASLVSGRNADDAASVAIATQLQAQVAGLKQISNNLAQASSAAQVADGAIANTQDILSKLKDVAQQAKSGSISDENRQKLDVQFQNLVDQLNKEVATTQFNGKNLIDGSLSGNNSLSLNSLLGTQGEDDTKLHIDNLASKTLFSGQSLNVLSADKASDAFSAIDAAQSHVAKARISVGAFQQTLNYSAATIDSAISNQEAARSELGDTDFLDAITTSQQASVQRNASLSLAAQGNRLPVALLKLVS